MSETSSSGNNEDVLNTRGLLEGKKTKKKENEKRLSTDTCTRYP